MEKRPNKFEYFLELAKVVAKRSTCHRRHVGCILVNSHSHIIATGYNGVPAGRVHCRDSQLCPGAKAESGSKLDECYAIHAEQNALIQCKDTQDIEAAYITTSPCIHCVKMLLNTSCQRIIFPEEYPAPTAKKLWEEAGRQWILYKS